MTWQVLEISFFLFLFSELPLPSNHPSIGSLNKFYFWIVSISLLSVIIDGWSQIKEEEKERKKKINWIKDHVQ